MLILRVQQQWKTNTARGRVPVGNAECSSLLLGLGLEEVDRMCKYYRWYPFYNRPYARPAKIDAIDDLNSLHLSGL